MIALMVLALLLISALRTKHDPTQVNFLPALMGFLGTAGGAAVATAGAGLIGGALDRRQRNKELEMQDPVYMRERYEAAGLNPLFGFSNVSAPSLGYAPTMGSTIANSVAAGFDTYANVKTLKIQNSRLEMEKDRLEKIANKTTLRPDVPGVYGNAGPNNKANTSTDTKGNTNSVNDPISGDDGKPIAGPNPRNDSHRIGGGWWKTNPWYSDAEDGETRYGDLISNATGGINMIADGVYTAAYWGNKGIKAYSKNAKNYGKSFDDKAIKTYQSIKAYKPRIYSNPTTFGYIMNPG